MEISNLSLSELRQLQTDVQKQIKKSEQAEMSIAREKILAIAQGIGVSVNELMGTAAHAPKSKVAVQFRSPDDASLQWTGRGRQPNWVKTWVAEGKSLDLLKI